MPQVTQQTLLVVKENDRITGSATWKELQTIKSLRNSGWEIDQSDINELENIGTTKLYGPNNRRVLFISIKS